MVGKHNVEAMPPIANLARPPQQNAKVIGRATIGAWSRCRYGTVGAKLGKSS